MDNFLHEHRKNSSLETMRDDLGVYLKILRSAMIELINKDYADFVNLSKDLIGLDKAINQLEVPLGQLRDEVMQIKDTLDAATIDMANGLDDQIYIKQQKQCMHSLGRVYKSITKLIQILETVDIKLDKLERAATEYNQLKFHASRCRDYLSNDITKNIESLEIKLMNNLDEQLMSCVKISNIDKLSRCLRIFVTLDKIDNAELLVKKKIISPLTDNIIVENNIYNEPLGLNGLYLKLLNILDNELKDILDITSKQDMNSDRKFNFLVNSYWPDVEEKIELRLKTIFAPGNPKLFHKRFIETLDYLDKLKLKCSNNDILNQLIYHPLYIQFLKKWNLPVYFQIRFQEIAGSVEHILCQSISSLSIINTDDFHLNTTEITWNSIIKIWSDDIFLSQLLHQFWKLNLQICSRYRTWISSTLKQNWILSSNTIASGNVIETKEPDRIEFLICMYRDLEKFISKLSNLSIVKLKFNSIKPSVEKILQDSLDDMINNLHSDLPIITENIVQELIEKSSPNLKQVSDIPRLFRRTMREKPTQPCAYVKNSLGYLIEFNLQYNKILPEAVNNWLLLTLSSLTKQYFSSVKDVLDSVKKTEESLRRLKQIRDKSTGTQQIETQGITDDEKIRIQLDIDVSSFIDTIKSFNINPLNIQHLDELVEVVQAAVKSKTSK